MQQTVPDQLDTVHKEKCAEEKGQETDYLVYFLNFETLPNQTL